MMTYKEENNKLFNDFLESFFYEDYRSKDIRGKKCSLELVVSPRCNLACRYCYVNKFKHETFSEDIFNCDKTLENTLKVLEWLKFNKMIPRLDIFSGELFAQQVGYDLMELMYNFYKDTEPELRVPSIVIPTNFTFMCSDKYRDMVLGYKEKFESLGIMFHLSASFDGKYMEENRPFTHDLDIDLNVIRDDDYYDKVFKFIKDTDSGLHPMVYSKNIDKWVENFEWFQSMMSKHGIDWKQIYLLQVRNVEWAVSENQHLYEFIQYLIDFAWNKLEKNKTAFCRFLLDQSWGLGFNLLHVPFTSITRGMTCSIQSDLSIRVSDLKVFPCHRLMYPHLEIGQYVEDADSVLVFDTKVAELGLSIYGLESKMLPVCATCQINNLCIRGCLGSQYEVNKNMFLPIPSVCRNSHVIASAVIDGLERIGVYDMVYASQSSIKRTQMEYIRYNRQIEEDIK